MDFTWGYFLNCGGNEINGKQINCELDENKYSDIVKSSLSLNPRIIGACCESNPNHIKSIYSVLNETTYS